MANRAIWGVRRRHEWLARPPKKERLGRRGRMRIGLEAALERKRGPEAASGSNKELTSFRRGKGVAGAALRFVPGRAAR